LNKVSLSVGHLVACTGFALVVPLALSGCLGTEPRLESTPLASTESITAEPEATRAAGGCADPANFPGWLAEFKQEALAQGIKPETIKAALDGVNYDASVVRADRGQRRFSLPFDKFASGRVNAMQLVLGRQALSNNAKLLAQIEQQYGVPGPVLTAYWGLESRYGTYNANYDVIRSIATLAFDCRRPDLYRPNLLAALRIVEKGDLTPRQMRGAWAGEMGQAQLMAKDYDENAVDYDGDGKRNLIDSKEDALASAANLISKRGWKRGEPWLEEVRVPATLDWKEADLAVQHPRSYWAAQGVTKADGSLLHADHMPASLVLPMGRNGPAFLAYDNFKLFLEWNRSLNSALTAAYFATRLAGAPAFRSGNGPVERFEFEQIVALQKLLAARGYDVGDADGKLGAKTRAAVKDVQMKLGLPADSYPTEELLQHLGTADGGITSTSRRSTGAKQSL
jgi:lytic murein transglycosylase